MSHIYLIEAKGNEGFVCSYCGELIGSIPKLGGEGLNEGICYDRAIDDKPFYLHIHCALKVSALLNRAVSDFIEKKTCG